MKIPKSQEKLIIKKLPNMGRKPYAYEIRHHDRRYLGDIYFIEVNDQWYISASGGFMLSATEINEINDFIKKLPTA